MNEGASADFKRPGLSTHLLRIFDFQVDGTSRAGAVVDGVAIGFGKVIENDETLLDTTGICMVLPDGLFGGHGKGR